MCASGIRFFSCSGSMGGTAAGAQVPNIEIGQLVAGLGSDRNRLGFFGADGAPSSPVIVGTYQNRSHATNDTGADLGVLINVKFTGASAAEVSGVPLTSTGDTLATIPRESGTLLVRFVDPSGTLTQTQNATFRAVPLTSTSGAQITNTVTGATIQAAQLEDTQGNAGDSVWTDLTGASNSLSLANQAVSELTHDYHMIVSLSPLTAGVKVNFGFYLQLEFL